jgi:glucose-6-phosphate isomerase
MLRSYNFFRNFSLKNKEFNQNLKKTKKNFKILKSEVKNNKIPFLASFEKNYKFNFSKQKINQFSKCKNIIVIGIGGSILGTQSIYSFFGKKIKKKFFFINNLDSNLILKYKNLKNLKNSCFIVVSKSGNTLETITNLGVIFSKKILKKRLVIITEMNDNPLMSIAKKYDAEVVEHKKFIGGRFSVLSETSMFPASLMGLNLSKFKDLKRLINNKSFVSSLLQNVAAIHTLNLRGVKNSIILNYDSSLNDLGYWYQQLIAESLGKKGKGINPILSFCPRDHHSLLQLYLDGPKDKFFTFLNSQKKESNFKISKEVISSKIKFLKEKNLDFVINSECKATKNIFNLNKIPFREITFYNKTEKELGEIFTFFVLETILLSRLMNINPFDQPAVEKIKIETKRFLKQ